VGAITGGSPSLRSFTNGFQLGAPGTCATSQTALSQLSHTAASSATYRIAVAARCDPVLLGKHLRLVRSFEAKGSRKPAPNGGRWCQIVEFGGSKVLNPWQFDCSETVGRIRRTIAKASRKRSEDVKTVRKTPPKIANTLNNRTNFRNVRHVCKPFSTRLARSRANLAPPRQPPGLVRKRRYGLGNHARRP
jgi:hypothetical protein